MAVYVVKLHKVWESTCEVEVEAGTEQEAVVVAEHTSEEEKEWSEFDLLEKYVGEVKERH